MFPLRVALEKANYSRTRHAGERDKQPTTTVAFPCRESLIKYRVRSATSRLFPIDAPSDPNET